MHSKKIVVLGTGGTIAGTAASPGDSTGYLSAQKSVGELLAAVPALVALPFDVVGEQVAQIDSKDMDLPVWQRLLQRCAHWLARPDVQGLVITHGTDTLEETAYLLQAVLAPSKPVVLTCAMRPATALSPDGPQNLMDAFAVAAHAGAQGVTVVCAGTIHGAWEVQKAHTWRLDAFSSGDAGALGEVRQGTVRLSRSWPSGHGQHVPLSVEKITGMTRWPRVEIVLSHAAASGAVVDALAAPEVAERFGAPPLEGLVVAGTGNGTLHHELEAALRRAAVGGIRVVRTTRCAAGQVLPTGARDAFAVSADRTPAKARVALMLELLGETAARPG